MKLLNKSRARLLLTHFREAIKNNDEPEADKIISLTYSEGYHLIASVMREEYQSFYGTSEEYDNALDSYVSYLCTR